MVDDPADCGAVGGGRCDRLFEHLGPGAVLVPLLLTPEEALTRRRRPGIAGRVGDRRDQGARSDWRRRVLRFYNQRGRAEQWVKEGDYTLSWMRLSCHDFVDNQVRF